MLGTQDPTESSSQTVPALDDRGRRVNCRCSSTGPHSDWTSHLGEMVCTWKKVRREMCSIFGGWEGGGVHSAILLGQWQKLSFCIQITEALLKNC